MQTKPPPGLVQPRDTLFKRTERKAAHAASRIARQLHLLPLSICALIVTLYAVLVTTPALARLELLALDMFFKLRPALETHPAIAYVEIAEDSIQTIGRWPWPRHFHAVMTHILTQWGAKAIVFDILFSERSEAFEDGALLESFQNSKNVYLPVVLEQKGKKKIWIHSLRKFEREVRGVGHINIQPDRDGTLRRIRPYEWYGKEIQPHLALRVAYDTLGRPLPLPGQFPFPLDQNGSLLVNWAGKWKDAFRHYSYVDILKSYEAVQKGEKPIVPPRKIRGKICVIGLTAFGHSDIKASPLEPSYPAVGVHTNVINSILSGQFLRPASPHQNALSIAAIGVIASILFVLFGNVASFMVGLALAVVWTIFCFILFWKQGVWLYPMHPVLVIISLYIFNTAYALLTGKKERLRLFQLATRDGLTGLYVIRHFRQLLNEAVREMRKRKQPLTVIMSDIDHFKKVNDTYGHGGGDMVLKEIARIFQSLMERDKALKDKTTVGRYGGEEFIIMLCNSTLTDAIFNVAEPLRKIIEIAEIVYEGTKIPVTISMGVATLHEDELVPDLMVHRADEALYHSKQNGRNRVSSEAKPENPVSSEATAPDHS